MLRSHELILTVLIMPFNAKKFVNQTLPEIRKQIGNAKAISAISGGVDSFVASILVSRALNSEQIHLVYVDNGLMRKGENELVLAAARKAGVRINVLDGKEKFFSALVGIEEPEKKRKIIGEAFIRIFENEAAKYDSEFLVQGTIAPDWIESGGLGRDVIKSHHNVGGLPKKMHLKLCEPLRELYKHEVRLVAAELGLPNEICNRQPFPGPGLAVRIVGEITEEKTEIVRGACNIVETEIDHAVTTGKIEKPWQYFAALLPSKTVGVRGDERAYQYTVVIRAVRSLDGMTANFSHLPADILEKISTRITNEIRTVGRVVYDITNKPPATIEME